MTPKRQPVTDDLVWCVGCENYHLPGQHDDSPPERPVAKRPIRVWTPVWWDRDENVPKVPCSGVEHPADVWFTGCEHEPTRGEFIEAARALCDETGADTGVLEVISRTYYTGWALSDRRHIEQWPLALIVLAGLREAGYEVVRSATPSDASLPAPSAQSTAPLTGHFPTFPPGGGCDAICAECGVLWPDCRAADAPGPSCPPAFPSDGA